MSRHPFDRAPGNFWTLNRLALGMAVTAGLAVVLTLADPGLTIDEPLDVRPGRTYLATLRAEGWRFFRRDVVDRVFADNAEHPPLGRWLLGTASTVGEPFEIWMRGADPIGLYVVSGRLAPALAFAVLVGIVTRASAARYGRASGAASGLALVFMPRVFAHAHLGALDTFISLFWVAALLAAERAVRSARPRRAMAAAGLVFGLALLTKIHAWFLIPVVGLWTLARLRPVPSRALGALAVWTTVGFVVFFAGWPWLWYDSAARLARYLGTGVERSTIRTLYFGTVYDDRAVPWHYPWFYFAATVPVGLHVLGALGTVRAARSRRDDPFPLLILGAMLLFLGLFSTNVPVYDGERLFLMVFPLWALLIGTGFGALWDRTPGRIALRAGLLFFLLAQGYGVVALHPFGLSYYNGIVGGLPGAERSGLELTYWGDAVDGPLLDTLARSARPGASAALAPTLYPGQGVATTNRALARRRLILADEDAVPRADWVVVSRRSAYWKPELHALIQHDRPTATRSRQGVWLSGLWKSGDRRP